MPVGCLWGYRYGGGSRRRCVQVTLCHLFWKSGIQTIPKSLTKGSSADKLKAHELVVTDTLRLYSALPLRILRSKAHFTVGLQL